MEQELYTDSAEALCLLNKELGIPSSHIAVNERGKYLTCLVHESWLSKLARGIRETVIHPGSDYELKLLLQSSHSAPPAPWQRVAITVVLKQPGQAESLPCQGFNTRSDEHQYSGIDKLQTVDELLDHISTRNQEHSLQDALRQYSDNNLLVSTSNNCQHLLFEDAISHVVRDFHGLSTAQLVEDPDKRKIERKKEANNNSETNFPQENIGESGSEKFSHLNQVDSNQDNFNENVLPVICAIESENAFFFVKPYLQHSLFDLVMFSPAVLSGSHIRPLFIIYQLLRAVQWYHRNMLTCGHLTLHDVKLYEGLWIFLQRFDLSCLTPCGCHHAMDFNQCNPTDSVAPPSTPVTEKLNQSEDIQSQRITCKEKELFRLVDQWVAGKISNYDYLMALNHSAGRRFGDPNYHPVFPWVTDFTQENGGYRDLTKSKFRLNKGDHQLDLTYKGVSPENDSNSVPHHVSDVLSDITYHVYLARRTPKTVLCEHVRTKWEPNEYPSSMQRMYHWTPDECIPEFFSDPTIFKSIHPDLPDLELPVWSSSPEEFISQHRKLLESEHVSRNLHHWIDLTFGYKLASKASIRAKNVCLHLVDKHQFITNHGVVQLFNKSHPSRLFERLPLSSILLSTKSHLQNQLLEDAKLRSARGSLTVQSVKVAVEDTPLSFAETADLSVEETDFMIGDIPGEQIEGINGKIQNTLEGTKEKQATFDTGEEKIVSSMPIVLPMDFNPLDYLDKLESVKSFKSQFSLEEKRSCESLPRQLSEMNFAEAARRDLQALGCLIVEMFAPEKVRLVSSSLTRDNRVQVITDLCLFSSKILPRFVRKGVFALLGEDLPRKRDRDQGDGLPPLTPNLLLHPQVDLFPFPAYFEELHSFLGRFCREGLIYSNDTEVSQDKICVADSSDLHSQLKMEFCFQDRKMSGYTMRQVDFAAHNLPSLIPMLDEEGLQLLFYHLEPLFKCSVVQLYAFTQLFDLLSQACGPKVTIKVFTKPLVKLFDSQLMANYEQILTQSFLSQLIVRFRLEQFLSHFINFVVDAVAFKSMGSKMEREMSDLNLVKTAKCQKDAELEAEDKPSPDELDHSKADRFHKEPSRESVEDEGTSSPFSEAVDRMTTDELDVRIYPDGLEEDETDHSQCLLADRDDEEEDDRDPWKSWSMEKEGKALDEDQAVKETKARLSPDLSSEDDQSEKDEDKDSESGICTSQEKTFEEESESKNEDVSNKEKEIQKEEPQEDQLIESNDAHTGDSAVQVERENDREDAIGCIDTEGDSSKGFSQDEDPDNEDEQGESCSSENEERLQDVKQMSMFSMDGTKEADTLSKESGTCGKLAKEPTIDIVSTPPKATVEKARKELTPGVVSELAAECVTWLAPRLGPVLTSRYLVSQLLHMLSRCYMGRVGVGADLDEDVEVDDRNARWVLFCLGHFCTLYGEAFMIYQYLPFVEKVIKAIHRSVSARNEAAVAGVLALLKYCLPYMSRESLFDHFDTFSHGVFQPLLRILASSNLKFPGGGSARAALCHSYVDLLTALSQKLERDLTQELMTPLIQQFFSCFELEHMKMKVFKLGGSSFTAVTSIDRNNGVEDKSSESRNEKNSTALDAARFESEIREGPTRPEHMEAFYKTSYYEELCQTFSAAMAHNAYVPLCGIMGSKFIEGQLYNHDLIWNLCCKHDPHLSQPIVEPGTDAESGDNGATNTDNQNGSQVEDVSQKQNSEENVAADLFPKELNDKNKEEGVSTFVENRTQSAHRTPSRRFRGRKRFRKESLERQDVKNKEEKWSSSASDQYLRGSWLEHWRHHLELKGRTGKFSLKEVKLQTFTGHNGSVRAMSVQDSEYYFLSASKDKTVKLWSLSNHGDGTAQSASSSTYYYHTRSVFAVDTVESQRHAASCDGSIHLWDPANGSCLAVLETPKNNPVVAMTAMPAPSSLVVAAMAESAVRFVDARQGKVVQEWKISTSNVAGSARDICCSPDGHWVAVGFSTGLVSVIDVRGGLLRSQRRAHTSDILQVKAFSNTSLITSSVDQGVFLWKEDGLRLRALKGHTDPLNCMLVFKDHVVSASTNNRIGIHVIPDESSAAEESYNSYKPRGDVFRGNITSLSYLPLNHLFLLGSDTGNITLCA